MPDSKSGKGVSVDIHLRVHFSDSTQVNPEMSKENSSVTHFATTGLAITPEMFANAKAAFEQRLQGSGLSFAETSKSIAVSGQAMVDAAQRAYESYRLLRR